MAKRGKLSKEFETIDEVVRPERLRHYQYLILIVCEDELTEKLYFESFKNRIPKETIFLTTVGTGLDPLGVVERSLEKRQELAKMCRREVDRVWVVFDKDDADKEPGKVKRFEQALLTVEQHQLKLAFSNEVFELWLLLHLVAVDPDKAMPRVEIYERLQAEIRTKPGHENFTYEHGNKEVLEKISVLGDETLAIARAAALVLHHADKPHLECNPKTLVHLLISDLYDWINYYSYTG